MRWSLSPFPKKVNKLTLNKQKVMSESTDECEMIIVDFLDSNYFLNIY